jgi:flagellar secretion chaperone FliS
VSGFGVKAYQQVAVDSKARMADPHAMILMLYDGAIEAIKLGESLMGTSKVAARCEALGKAVRIVEEGLKASVDRKAGGQLSERLVGLYDYIEMRLLQANLRKDAKALAEARKLLTELRSAWAQIGGTPAAQTPPQAAAAGRPAAARAPALAGQ